MKAGVRKRLNLELARKNYATDVLLEPCPKCGVSGGQYCKRKAATGTGVAATPHEERVKLAHLGREF